LSLISLTIVHATIHINNMKYIRNILITIVILLFAGLSVRLIPALFEKKRAEGIYPVRVQCRNFEDAINLYKANYGAYPSESNALSIIVKDDDCLKLLKSTNLNDPWGTPFRFRIIGGHAVVDSAGKDRKFDTSDDVHSF
jgi:type II secretory pathway pseudopilin PulG